MKEMTEQQAESEAEKLPLPEFISESDELWFATEFVRANSKSFGCLMMGIGGKELRKQWRNYRKHRLQSMRFDNWARETNAQWDSQRGKYLVQFPDAFSPKSGNDEA